MYLATFRLFYKIFNFLNTHFVDKDGCPAFEQLLSYICDCVNGCAYSSLSLDYVSFINVNMCFFAPEFL